MSTLAPQYRAAPVAPIERRDVARVRISVVVPAHDEQEVLPEFHARTTAVLESLGSPYELVYVNDGSRDGTMAVLRTLRASDDRVAIIDLSRHFGKEIAMTAGLDQARGDIAIVMDADLQDPPEFIPELIAGWCEGYDVVYAQRVSRDGERWLKTATSRWFHRVMGRLSPVTIPADTGDFRLLSRNALTALANIREHHRYMKGLFAWIGFPQKAVPLRRDARAAGRTKFTYWKLWNFAIDGFTSFSVAPLKVATYSGLGVAMCSFLYAVWIIYKTLRFGEPVRGYPSLMVVILFLGGVQLLAIGVVGEYLGRMFNEVKQRPLYVLNGVEQSRLATQSPGPGAVRAVQ